MLTVPVLSATMGEDGWRDWGGTDPLILGSWRPSLSLVVPPFVRQSPNSCLGQRARIMQGRVGADGFGFTAIVERSKGSA